MFTQTLTNKNRLSSFKEIQTLTHNFEILSERNKALYDFSHNKNRQVLVEYYFLGKTLKDIFDNFCEAMKIVVNLMILSNQSPVWVQTCRTWVQEKEAMYHKLDAIGRDLMPLQKNELELAKHIYQDELDHCEDSLYRTVLSLIIQNIEVYVNNNEMKKTI